MPIYTTETVVKRRKRFILETPWPQGAPIGELHKMLHAVSRELEERFGTAAAADTAAWIIPEDDQIVIYYDLPDEHVAPTGGPAASRHQPAAPAPEAARTGGDDGV